MARFNVLDKKIDELSEFILDSCDRLDELDMGVSNYHPDGKSREMCLICLNMFLMHMSIADGELADEEVALINYIGRTNFEKDDLLTIIEKAEIGKEAYAKQVPVILRTFVDADNDAYNNAKESEEIRPLSVSLYELFATAGIYMMVVDENIYNEEFDRLMEYLKTIYVFIRQNLKFGYGDMRKPEDFVLKMLKSLKIELDRKHLKNKTKAKDGGEDDNETGEDDNETGDEEESLEELLTELNDMVGLDEVKYEVTSLMNLLRVKMIREQMGLDMPPVSMHLVFSGNPGTGKTTVARLLAKIYKKIGVLSKGQLVEVDRSGLVGGYVGQTALKVSDVIKSAKGGVLFIDEAYSLTPENVPNDYGLEAVETLIKSMEDNRKDLVVIVAGYPNLMNQFLASNPGLRSRFNKFIYFRDYNSAELVRIFGLFCEKHGYRPSRPALDFVKEYFEEKCIKKEENFANAREVRNLFEYAISRQANRVMLIANPSQENMTLLKRSDVSGEEIDLGKQQFVAQRIMNDLSKEKRHGLEMEYMGICMDELELSAGAEELLYKNEIKTIKDFLDYIDEGKSVSELAGMNAEAEEEILEKLSILGFVCSSK